MAGAAKSSESGSDGINVRLLEVGKVQHMCQRRLVNGRLVFGRPEMVADDAFSVTLVNTCKARFGIGDELRELALGGRVNHRLSSPLRQTSHEPVFIFLVGQYDGRWNRQIGFSQHVRCGRSFVARTHGYAISFIVRIEDDRKQLKTSVTQSELAFDLLGEIFVALEVGVLQDDLLLDERL
jgi:hypothetical protein